MGQLKHYSLYVNGPPAIAKAIDRPALPPLMLMRERIASTIIMFKGQETGGSSREKTVKARAEAMRKSADRVWSAAVRPSLAAEKPAAASCTRSGRLSLSASDDSG